MIASNARRHGIEETDQCADQWRADGGERDLSDRERGSADEYSDNERTDYARAPVKGSEASGKTGKLCGVSQYVANARLAFLWSRKADLLRHIFLCG